MTPNTKNFEFLVRGLARRYARRVGDVEDFEQEGRLAVFLAIKTWKDDSHISLKNYVAFKIRHALKEFTRTHYRPGFVSMDANIEKPSGESLVSLHDELGVQPQQEICIEANRVADAICSQLSPPQKAVVLLIAQGVSNMEVGRQMGLGESTVRFFHKEALRRLTDSSEGEISA